MRLLLDTHTFIWWDSDPARLLRSKQPREEPSVGGRSGPGFNTGDSHHQIAVIAHGSRSAVPGRSQ